MEQPRRQGTTEFAGSLVLIVEDDHILGATLELILRGAAFRTERARDGRAALELWRATQPDVVLLDLGLPEVDGREVLRSIRESSGVPVLILTARTEESDELDGLGLGADDYLVKPVTSQRLVARVEAVLRRDRHAMQAPEGIIRVGGLEVDSYRAEARLAGIVLSLTPTEFSLLRTLATTPGRAVTRSELYDAALPDRDAYDRAVDVHVANLRRKLREVDSFAWIETVRGVGYRLGEPVA